VVVHTVAVLIVRRVLGVLGCGPTRSPDAVEIAVLRHQLAVLHRQVPRPRLWVPKMSSALVKRHDRIRAADHQADRVDGCADA
jgi:hypothetical protein